VLVLGLMMFFVSASRQNRIKSKSKSKSKRKTKERGIKFPFGTSGN
jgi:hypothetical protein